MTRSKDLIEDPAYPLKAAAAYAGVSAETLRKWLYAGKVKAIKNGRMGNIRIRRSELNRLLDEQEM